MFDALPMELMSFYSMRMRGHLYGWRGLIISQTLRLQTSKCHASKRHTLLQQLLCDVDRVRVRQILCTWQTLAASPAAFSRLGIPVLHCQQRVEFARLQANVCSAPECLGQAQRGRLRKNRRRPTMARRRGYPAVTVSISKRALRLPIQRRGATWRPGTGRSHLLKLPKPQRTARSWLRFCAAGLPV